MKELGVYVSLSPDGKLKRDLVTLNGKITLEDSLLEQEIINFSELVFTYYALVVDHITITANYLLDDYRENNGAMNLNVFEFMMDTAADLVKVFEEEDPLHGTLTRAVVGDTIPRNDGTVRSAIETATAIVPPLQEVVHFQRLANEVLSDMRNGVPLDFKEKYSVLQRTDVTQALFMSEDLTAQYFFRSPAGYYRFLLLNFIMRKPSVELCECCGRFFVPKTKKKTLYCDRVIKDNKTCKDLGPRLKHKKDAGSKKVVEEFDRARQRMYKRYERTLDINRKSSDKDLTLSQLYEWIDSATQARNSFLKGELSEEEALKVIMVP